MTETPEAVRAGLAAAMAGAATPLAAADALCQACVNVLEVDGASISLMYEGTTRGTFGSSGATSRRLDELQFTYGEGPCLDAVTSGVPVLVADLDDPAEQRWPAFRGTVLESGIGSVFALPVGIASRFVGALDLFAHRRGPLTAGALVGGLFAAELAALPLLNLMTADVDWDQAAQGGDGWEQLASLERVEVYQATGMLVGALDVDPVAALILLRAYAFAHSMTASDVAYDIVRRRLPLDVSAWATGKEG